MNKIFLILFQNSYKNLKEVLASPEAGDLNAKLSVSVRWYLSLIYNVKHFNTIYSTGVFLWMVSTVVITIANTFLYVLLIFEQGDMSDLVVITVRVVFTYASAIVILTEVGKLQESNKRMLSFLYKYPSSKLRPEEASQIELILSTFRLCKPSLNALGIFDLGVKLCAACSGTIITYILVLLQFYLPWANKSQESH
ncbi:hypothetical protein RN001_014655 [Aquatica leii]|uniref:Uncharacterized protein n=1 Tax=Aquatica leii TaxID=1421715 RepID=A0AAN7S6A5_9COLE|nr:hypothetical protein RN001_014655 [Aquatica leii]